jgi:hypothetical protein
LQAERRLFGFAMISGFMIMLVLQRPQQVDIQTLYLSSASAPHSSMRERPLDSPRRAPFVPGFCYKLYQT